MKKIIYLSLLAGVLFVQMSCSKMDPEKEPLEEYTEDYIFDPNDPAGTLAIQFLNNVYTHLPDGFNRIGNDMLDVATDDAIPSRDNTSIDVLRSGRLSSVVSNPDGVWNEQYLAIRKANIFLSKIDVVPLTDEVKNNWKADARFLRAMFYFELVKRYGGVPLIGDTVYKVADKVEPKRNSFEECVNYIVSECDAVKSTARPDPVSLTDWGRVSKGVVLTLKAKVLNYAASELYNGGNIALSDGNPANDALQGYPNFDAGRWQKAALAAKDVMDLGIYSLESGNNLFIQRRNNEVIFSYLRPTNRDIPLLNGPIGFNTANTKGQGLTSPTQDLVDAFPMISGKPITDVSYNKDNPYASRDPRLDKAILYNGLKWLNRGVETFEGGLDKPNTTNLVQTKTGYYTRKFMAHFTTSAEYSLQHLNFNIFRYADVMLMYAEALNEFNIVPPAEVYQILKDIRKRAGLQLANAYGVPATMNKTEARNFIRNERRIELCLEEQRYWDVRRWKIAEQEFNKDLQGMRITKTGATTFGYQRFVAGKIVFNSPRMYMYPIPNSEVLKNKNMVQNSGW
ncbi:RagB/SusD family nutrient uptake outer membrane protein [Pedobacter nyackensis]|uniref:Starch-binding associating with outer membrane n=1 Tax=Pedobacter nyackensis TaxID=475255 RepID=A0A1W2CKZ9_9SPHI|nr:RagB/SusD family nutrient uptake outer membrane protein [Pedobacter nyackensis]SMC85861.1 Starch-binding associating with outer membrane [Pedobacter nyackensis]